MLSPFLGGKVVDDDPPLALSLIGNPRAHGHTGTRAHGRTGTRTDSAPSEKSPTATLAPANSRRSEILNIAVALDRQWLTVGRDDGFSEDFSGKVFALDSNQSSALQLRKPR